SPRGCLQKGFWPPEAPVTDGIYYRTGDLARWLPDGNIEFLGRIDHQVKIRGHRVALGEIENGLLDHPEINEAVVLVRQSEAGDKHLCAYYVPVNIRETVPGAQQPESGIRTYLTQNLPDYMVPALFCRVEKIPLTPNGKIDRKALPEPEGTGLEKIVPPESKTEKALVDIWSEILETPKDKLGINTNFFHLGGHSLSATAMVAKIQHHNELNLNVPLAQVFKTPTIKQLAEYIETAQPELKRTQVKDDNLVLLRAAREHLKEQAIDETHGENLFLIHDGSGDVEGYVELCQRLRTGFDYWGIRAHRLPDSAPRQVTVEELAGNYLEKICKIQPAGPYCIAGWSLGGAIAFEMVRQLEQRGEETRCFAMIDTVAPSPRPIDTKRDTAFLVEDELDWVKKHLPEIETNKESDIEVKLKSAQGIRQFWVLFIRHLRDINYDLEKLRQSIPEMTARVIPGFHRQGAEGLITYVNMQQTLIDAMERYIPGGKLKAPVHFVGAVETKVSLQEGWNNFLTQPFKYYRIEGDHFS
ncbi:MAG: AMP-binding protein, partial [bacterium]|nr:AMP-binding protein [bacterium]